MEESGFVKQSQSCVISWGSIIVWTSTPPLLACYFCFDKYKPTISYLSSKIRIKRNIEMKREKLQKKTLEFDVLNFIVLIIIN